MRRFKKSLRNRIIEDCLKRGDFTLSSGGKSDYLIDLSQLYLSGDGSYLIGKTIYHHTKNVNFNAIGGPLMGAVPLTAATVAHYWKRERRIKEGFWVCSAENADQVSSYQNIEGRVTRRHKVIVIEDVCTTGASAALAVQAVRELVGAKVVKVIALVDREEGARERFEEMGIEFDPIFKARKLLEYANNGSPPILDGAAVEDSKSGVT
jgi:orotate phosphoribosyltransferase